MQSTWFLFESGTCPFFLFFLTWVTVTKAELLGFVDALEYPEYSHFMDRNFKTNKCEQRGLL